MGLKILITNNTLASRADTELYVRDVAVALLKRGHTPIAYSTLLGEVAQDLLVSIPLGAEVVRQIRCWPHELMVTRATM